MANCQNNMRYTRRSTFTPQVDPRHCGCTAVREGCPDTCDIFPEGTAPAMAYVPWQKWQNLYDLSTAFMHGTIFEDLDKPFLMKGGRCR